MIAIVKRKTTTSSEVKKRWIDKTYKRYTVNFRYDTQKDLIDYIEGEKESGVNPSELFAKGIEELKKEG